MADHCRLRQICLVAHRAKKVGTGFSQETMRYQPEHDACST